MTTEPTCDPREITDFRERFAEVLPALVLAFVEALPDLMLAFVAACEADPAFRALCRQQGVEGGAGAAIEAVRQAAEEAR
jgi:hypothetical protein